ncbi:peptide/nickel transport system substrate-binding protein [Roseiarcus fermentans]|uniref:Peptide/nickel transport system substrate-binding protein n=1 Tax=Roseiarcus fermentans TaxID=1473586 RepID=A0A366FJM5_9HYPH|nr:ABC transporter substrate-binding protein [Roseiarcus fermentans]RBP14316.1 peptide/nickel transport system substrate-binding protein [Roseiarcus fermentans]
MLTTRAPHRRRVRGAIAGAALAGATFALSGASAETLTIAATAGPTTLDPTTSTNGVPSVWFPNLSYAALIHRAPDGRSTPGLALDWAYSQDRLSFVMNLREGVKFSDGSPMTAADVVNWLKHYKEKGSFTAWLGKVTDISATGPMQVTLKLSTPDPMLPYGLDQDGMAGDVVGPSGLAHPDTLGSTTNGAGPYMIDPKATILNSQYVYVKNPYYWAPDEQHWDKVVVKIISDGNALMSALKTGQVQVAEGAATEAAEAEGAGLKIISAPSAMLGMYIGDIDGKIVPALKDVRVRQALNFAIDRKGIAESLYGKYGKPTTQFVPQGIGGYVAKLEDFYPYDPKKAKALLAEAGFADSVKFTLVEQPAVSSGDLLAQAMVANWKDVGIDVTLKPTDSFATYVPLMGTQKYPATTLTFQYSVQLTDTQQLVTNPALYNYMGFTDAKANALAEAQRRQDIESPAGVAAAEASETYMVENAFLTPVVSVDALLFATKGVDGLKFATYPWPDPTNWKPAK